jgi:hypothetical protein
MSDSDASRIIIYDSKLMLKIMASLTDSSLNLQKIREGPNTSALAIYQTIRI